jgi:hypothetical protein
MNRNNTYWTSAYGKRELVKNLTDSHLANIIDFLTHYIAHGALRSTLPLMIREARLRGLSTTFLSRAQIPHVDPKGRWRIYDYSKMDNVLVSKKKAKL